MAYKVSFLFLTLKEPKMKITEFENSIDPDEAAHAELPHLDPHCLPSCLFFHNTKQFGQISFDVNFVIYLVWDLHINP